MKKDEYGRETFVVYFFEFYIIFVATPQVIMSAELADIADDAAEKAAAGLDDEAGGLERAGKVSDEDFAKAQAEMKAALEKGDIDTVKSLLDKDPSVFKDPNGAFRGKIDNMSAEEAQGLAKRAEDNLAILGKDAKPEDLRTARKARAKSDEVRAKKIADAKATARQKELGDRLTKYGAMKPEEREMAFTALDDSRLAVKSAERTATSLVKNSAKYMKDAVERATQDAAKVTEDGIKAADKLEAEQGKIDKIAENMGVDRTAGAKDEFSVEKLRDDLINGDPAARTRAAVRLDALRRVLESSAEVGALEDAAATKVIADANKSFLDQMDSLADEIVKDPDIAETKEVKAADGSVTKVSKLDTFIEDAQGKMTQDVKASARAQTDRIETEMQDINNIEATKTGKTFSTKSFSLSTKLKGFQGSFKAFGESVRTATSADVKDAFVSGLEEGGSMLKSVGKKLHMVAETLIQAVLFMIPNIFQSAFLAQKQQVTDLTSWALPIEFGGFVYQVPTSCINIGNPTSSWPLYVVIPVSNVGDPISSTLATMYNDYISGPTTNNSLQASIHSVSAQIFSFGTNTETTLSRYHLDPNYMLLSDIALVYGGVGAYVTTGSVALNSSDSTGNMMSVRTGAVVNATGDMVNATGLDGYKAVPLIGVTQWGGLQLPQTAPVSQGLQTVAAALPPLLAKFEVADTQNTYTQYQNIGSGSSGNSLATIVRDVLDTACVGNNGSLKSSDCQSAIVSGLEAIAAGINIVPGAINPIFHLDTLTPEQFLQIAVPAKATESITKLATGGVSGSYGYTSKMGGAPVSVSVASNKAKKIGRLGKKTSASNKSKRMGRLSADASQAADEDAASAPSTSQPVAPAEPATLGMVIPVYGWGTTYYSSIFNSPDFVGFDPSKVAGGSIGGAVRLTAGETSEKATTDYAAMEWASHDTLWAAQGCWMYLATQTPFMQYITQKQVPATPTFGAGLVDYVVFLDDSLNVIPMMAPTALTVTYTNDDGSTGTFKKIEMYVNPEIKYWTSLLAYNQSGFENVMYDLDGNAYADPNLANAIYVPASQGQAPGGFLGAVSTAFPEIYNQFQVHSAAILDYFNRAPIKYGNCSLQINPKYTLDLGGSSIETYTGFSCYTSKIPSLAIAIQSYPITSSISFEELSSTTRGHFLIDVVTDIAYQLTGNNWNPVAKIGFANSPVNSAGKIRAGANTSQFYFLSGLYQGNIPADLLAFVTAQRKKWLSTLGSATASGDANALVGQCSFGTVQVGIRASDLASGAYVYLNTTGNSSATQAPRGMYVILTPNKNGGLTLSRYNSKAAKQYLMNLVTGAVYDRNGQVVMVLPAAQLEPMVKSWTGSWDSWLNSSLAQLQTDQQKRTTSYAQDEQDVDDYLNGVAQKNSAGLESATDVVAIISRMQPLPSVYAMLEYDSTSGNYAYVSPASPTDPTSKLYMFMSTGYVYQQNGSMVSRYTPQHLQAVRDQYGVVVDADGKQTLGMPMLQPSMALEQDETSLTLTTSGSTMINLGVAGMYLGAPIALPAGYGLFYNSTMGTYYILDSKKQRYLSIEGGYSYQLNGAPIRENRAVAMAGAGDFMLLYKNASNFYQAFMSDGSEYINNSSSNTNASLTGVSSGTQYTMNTNKALTQFTLQGATGAPKVYTVTKQYVWNAATLIPIDEHGALLTTMPSSAYTDVEVVHDSAGNIAYLIFDSVMYQPSTAQGAAPNTFVPINASAAGAVASLTVTDGLIDSGTQMPYFSITNGATTYKYVCEAKTFDSAEQKMMRATIMRGSTAASPVAAKFGPMHTETKEIGGKNLQMSVPAFTTYTIFVADLPKTTAGVTLTRVSLENVSNIPTLSAQQSALLQIGLGNVFQTGNGRFVCAIGGKGSATPGMLSFSYVSNPAYVDLETAALYDQKTGVSLGLCLNMSDFVKVLNSCMVKAVYDTAQQKELLVYKSPTPTAPSAPLATPAAITAAAPAAAVTAQPAPKATVAAAAVA